MRLNKSPQEWALVIPAVVVDGSAAQNRNVLAMALQDIARLAARLSRMREALQAGVDSVVSLQGKVTALESALAAAREADAQLVRDMLEMPPWCDHVWARSALVVAARIIDRGRHWTTQERLDNLMAALEDIPAPQEESGNG
jgi:hypothetical protein